jgi:hypothetical protein
MAQQWAFKRFRKFAVCVSKHADYAVCYEKLGID